MKWKKKIINFNEMDWNKERFESGKLVIMKWKKSESSISIFEYNGMKWNEKCESSIFGYNEMKWKKESKIKWRKWNEDKMKKMKWR